MSGTRRRPHAKLWPKQRSLWIVPLVNGCSPMTSPKGDAVATVRIAAIQGAKRTSSLIPLCHPLPIESVSVNIEPTPDGAVITVTATVTAKTGVEMEAMTGAAVGAVALYDMIKGVDRGSQIGGVRLLEKSGGRSGEWRRE